MVLWSGGPWVTKVRVPIAAASGRHDLRLGGALCGGTWGDTRVSAPWGGAELDATEWGCVRARPGHF